MFPAMCAALVSLVTSSKVLLSHVLWSESQFLLFAQFVHGQTKNASKSFWNSKGDQHPFFEAFLGQVEFGTHAATD